MDEYPFVVQMPESPVPDDRLSSRLVKALADAKGVDPTELSPPLYEVVDPEALNSVFRPTHDGSARSRGRITFVHGNYEVTVNSEGSVDVKGLQVAGGD